MYPSASTDPSSVGHFVEGGDVAFVSMYEPLDQELYADDFQVHRAFSSNGIFRFTWGRP